MHFLQLTDRLVIIEIATFHSHWDGQPCSGQIRPQSASDHWPLGANLNEFQLEILKNAVSQAPGNLWYHSDSGRQRQKWRQLQHGGEMQAVNEKYKMYI